MKVSEIKQQLDQIIDAKDPIILEYKNDPRLGVQKIVKSTLNRIKKVSKQQLDFQNRFQLEQREWKLGNKLVAGLDEVGRGCLAGPVVSAAVILDNDFKVKEVYDSKQLSDVQRQRLFPDIINQAVSVGIGVISSEKIDQLGILEATKQSMLMALDNLKYTPSSILVDAVKLPIQLKQQVMFKGETKSNSIAAASIVAKVYRDSLMKGYHQLHPVYNFEKNVGYGTKQHLNAINNYGSINLHRKTFAPISNLEKHLIN